MAILQWSNFFSVGIEEIDNQHKNLIDILNEIYDGVKECHAEETLRDVIPKLVKYTKEHFVYEEKVMIDIGYPDFDKHFQKHYKLAEQAGHYMTMMENGEHINYLELTVLVSDWLKDHILEDDKDYAKYVVNKEAHILND